MNITNEKVALELLSDGWKEIKVNDAWHLMNPEFGFIGGYDDSGLTAAEVLNIISVYGLPDSHHEAPGNKIMLLEYNHLAN